MLNVGHFPLWDVDTLGVEEGVALGALQLGDPGHAGAEGGAGGEAEHVRAGPGLGRGGLAWSALSRRSLLWLSAVSSCHWPASSHWARPGLSWG